MDAERIVVPTVKKEKGKVVEEYRKVTLTQTAYKVYTAILAERLKDEVDEKTILPPNQTGFKRGKCTMDNMYVLNSLIYRQVEKRKGGW